MQAIEQLARDGRVFYMQELLPVADPHSGRVRPAYQVYLAMAFFKHCQAAMTRGRDGYIIENVKAFRDEAVEAFNALPA